MTTYRVSAASAALTTGDVVCLDGANGTTVMKALPTPLGTSRGIVGVALAPPYASFVEVADTSTVSRQITGLSQPGSLSITRVNGSARCELLSGAPSAGDVILGICDTSGVLTLQKTYALVDTGVERVLTSAPQVFNVRDYGAKGDSDLQGGGTDDYPAFVAAMNAMGNATYQVGGAGFGVLYVPRGAYRLSRTLHITRQMIVTGDPSAFKSPATLPVFDQTASIQPPAWSASQSRSVGDIVMPTAGGNYYYVCTTAGTTGGSQPGSWLTTIGNTVTDNTVVWTCAGIIDNACVVVDFINTSPDGGGGDGSTIKHIGIRQPRQPAKWRSSSKVGLANRGVPDHGRGSRRLCNHAT